MASVYRVTAIWNNFPGAPGYSRFSFSDLTDNASRNSAGAKVQALFEGIKAYLPQNTTISVQGQVDEFDVSSGALIGSASMTALPATTTSSATAASFAGPAGGCITWNTSLIVNRRRLRGRTFVVPVAGPALDTNGSLSSAFIAAVNTAATTFIATTAPRPNVWGRQWNNANPPVQVGGTLAAIDAYVLRDQAAVLRSRRT